MSVEGQRMEIGAKVRNKSGVGPVMTVKLVTPQGYIVCTWLDPDTREPRESMFFAEMLRVDAPQPVQKTNGDR
jgi:uncharacterized protein YodC (DUF2158 family)